MIDPRVIVEAVELRDGRKLEQVLVALLIFGEEEEMARSFVVGGFVGEFLSGKVGFEIYPSRQAFLSFQKVSKSMYWNGQAVHK